MYVCMQYWQSIYPITTWAVNFIEYYYGGYIKFGLKQHMVSQCDKRYDRRVEAAGGLVGLYIMQFKFLILQLFTNLAWIGMILVF